MSANVKHLQYRRATWEEHHADVQESPLWLLDRGYDDDALATLRRIAAVNNRECRVQEHT